MVCNYVMKGACKLSVLPHSQPFPCRRFYRFDIDNSYRHKRSSTRVCAREFICSCRRGSSIWNYYHNTRGTYLLLITVCGNQILIIKVLAFVWLVHWVDSNSCYYNILYVRCILLCQSSSLCLLLEYRVSRNPLVNPTPIRDYQKSMTYRLTKCSHFRSGF